MQKLMIAAAAAALAVSAAAAQDWTAPPNFGDVRLSAGFSPDPYRRDVTSGGVINVASSIGGSCRGWVSNAPDIDFYYQAGSFQTITVSAYSNDDVTLVINDPNGNWYCDDDSAGNLDARLVMSAQSGLYNIWVGSYSQGEYIPATVTISEIGN